MTWHACAVGLLGWSVAAGGMAAEFPSDVAPRTPGQWLEFMGEALRERSFEGVFSYFDGEDLSTLRIVHAVVDGVQRERLVHLDGEPREIVRSDDDVVCILQPDDAILKLEAALPSGPFARAFADRPAQVGSHYDVSLEGRDRVADRGAVRLAVTPRDQDRYGYRLWIDEGKGLLLRSELLDVSGERLEIFQFVDVRIDEPVNPVDLEPTFRDGAVAHRLGLESSEHTASAKDDAVWRFDWMPSGFSMAVSDVRRSEASSHAVETLLYSDGLAAFSVFIEEIPTAGAANVVSRQGGTVAVTHLTAGPGGRGYLVTVVGEVPIGTAQRVARSLRFAADE